MLKHQKQQEESPSSTLIIIIMDEKWFKRRNSDANAINGCRYAMHTEQKVCKLFQKAISMYWLQ